MQDAESETIIINVCKHAQGSALDFAHIMTSKHHPQIVCMCQVEMWLWKCVLCKAYVYVYVCTNAYFMCLRDILLTST
jgi:hypothetical protein